MVEAKRKNGILSRLKPRQLHLLLGEVTALMMLSHVHRHFQIRDIADILLPTLNLNQFRIYRNARREPVALVTWAFLSPEVEKLYLGGKAVLSEKELSSGDIIYITDFIAPYGHAMKVAKDLKTNVFPNDKAKALRFTEQGKPRKRIWTFTGVNYRKKFN